MKVQLKPLTYWEVSCNGIALGTMREVSRWEGLMKLQEPDTKQVVIVEAPSGMAEAMAGIAGFGPPVEACVLKLSPSLLDKIPAGDRERFGVGTEAAP